MSKHIPDIPLEEQETGTSDDLQAEEVAFPNADELVELARRHQPPQSWFDSDETLPL